MICPHCDKTLLRRQRPDKRCVHCERRFALEPKENALTLHDVRMRKLADKLSAGGQLRYTMPQLWWTASRARIKAPEEAYNGCGLAAFYILLLAVVLTVAFGSRDPEALVALILGAVVLLVALCGLAGLLRRRARRYGAHELPMPLSTFAGLALQDWPEVYGGPPPGLVDAGSVPAPVIAHPRLALVCADRSVLACLAANGAPETYAMTLIDASSAASSTPPVSAAPASAWGHHVPPGVPLLVLHDASAAGLLFAAGVRADFGDRAVLAGLPPRVALSREHAVRLHGKPLPPTEADRLRAACRSVGLDEQEADWLARGWWSPLAAVPPAKLLSAVARAAERTEAAADPDRHQARQVGFLTWPTA